MTTFFWMISAYLLGSVSFAIVLSKIFGMPDPRSYGSNNPGATNMLRSGRKKVAFLTLLGDVLKGFLPVFLARHFTNLPIDSLCAIALAAFLGHLYPIFFSFKGGKGVATFFGAIWGLFPIIAALITVAWLIVASITRYSSASALIASLLAFFFLGYHWGTGIWMIWFCAMVALLFWRHRRNIDNIRKGTESKLFTKK